MTSTSTSSSNRQLRTRLLLNEALPQNNGGIGCNIGIRGGDSATINISIMGVAIVVVIFCLLCKNMIPSDDNNDNDNNDTDSNSNSNTNANANNADNSSYAVNHKMNPEEEEEEERKKNIIFKLFRSEHMEEKITCNHIRRHSGERKIIIKEDGSLSSFDEEEGHRIAMLSSSSSSSSPSHNSNSNSNTEKTVSDVCAICLDEYHEGDTIVYPSKTTRIVVTHSIEIAWQDIL